MSEEEESNEKRVVKLQIHVSESELKLIDDWRFSNRAPSRSFAVRELINDSLQRWLEAAEEENKDDGGASSA